MANAQRSRRVRHGSPDWHGATTVFCSTSQSKAWPGLSSLAFGQRGSVAHRVDDDRVSTACWWVRMPCSVLDGRCRQADRRFQVPPPSRGHRHQTLAPTLEPPGTTPPVSDALVVPARTKATLAARPRTGEASPTRPVVNSGGDGLLEASYEDTEQPQPQQGECTRFADRGRRY